jgi:hypothetical protein
VVPVDDPARAVMPETFRIKDGTPVAAMRRRNGKNNRGDAYSSADGGEP